MRRKTAANLVLALLVAAAILVLLLPPLTRRDSLQSPPAASQKPFIALIDSRIYHTRSCGFTARAEARRKVYFATTREAEAGGRRPCQKCRP